MVSALANGDSPSVPGRRRVLTWPLAGFLGLVALVVGIAAWRTFRSPSPLQARLALADGDLDGDERRVALRVLVEAGAGATEPAAAWAAWLAAVALDDRAAFGALAGSAGGERPPGLPAAADRDGLGLGDPLVALLARAWIAEAESRQGDAARLWGEVQIGCELVDRPLLAELAGRGITRNR